MRRHGDGAEVATMKRSGFGIALGFGGVIGALLVVLQFARLPWMPPRPFDLPVALVVLAVLVAGIAVGVRLRPGQSSSARPSAESAATRIGADDSPLSPREHEVLLRLAEGCSNADIARRHFVSENTVKTQVRQICAKLDARSRLQAVARAREAGLLR